MMCTLFMLSLLICNYLILPLDENPWRGGAGCGISMKTQDFSFAIDNQSLSMERQESCRSAIYSL